ncbi:MAG TPA: excinuclease ABC subunit UvrC [Vicinamibacterales bacterium]|nr:excinuclease ABC subunit UvrC [Vicinamibacterales bacterium]
MAIHDLKGQIGRLPQQPGVYAFLGRDGETLYVGKARVLRDRVRNYLAAEGTSPRHDALLREASALDVIVTDSVMEALALENRLIKQRNPRYNVLLRDDKTYPYLQLTTTERAPRLLVARRVERDGNVYAGPFMPAVVARRTMQVAHRWFGIRSCNEIIDGKRDRPCLEYDIKRCLAPCVETICSIDEYGKAVDQARLLIEGRQDELIGNLRGEMTAAAGDERFEHAAHLRDAIRTVETLRDRRNNLETPSLGDRDAFGVKTGPAGAMVQVFQMRRGRVVDRIELATDTMRAHGASPAERGETVPVAGDVEVIVAAIQQFYSERPAPPEVHVPVAPEPDEQAAIETWLSESSRRRVRLVVPKRGEKRGLLDLAMRNAALAWQSHFAEGGAAAFDALDTLRVALNLPALPRRIECFDISTLQGRETVASMVVCVEGRMKKSEYRKFKIRGQALGPGHLARERAPAENPPGPSAQGQGPDLILDDFASMAEVVLRRYKKVLEAGGPFPDLILIDGGKGQLAAAYASLRELGLERLMAVGIAKQEELLFTRDRVEGLALPHDSAALRLVQRIRDEAHRFAITFHRQRRASRDLRSSLDDVLGVGPRKRKQLLTTFGSVAGVRRASREELEAVVGVKTAEAVIRHFAQ